MFVEGDLWPRLVLAAHRQGIPLLLLNARHSKTRERFPSTYLTLLNGFKGITCRSQQVADGFRAIGVAPHVLQILPDLRITASGRRQPDSESHLAEHTTNRTVWLATSTHQQDEEPVLAAHERLLASDPDALLIIAPRYPRRGSQLVSNARKKALEVARRSTQQGLLPSTQVYIADTLGELALFFSVASLAFVGGSFGDQGGHNPYEPASYGLPVISGIRVRNFDDAYAALAHAGAAILVADQTAFERYLLDLLSSDKGARMGEAGRNFVANCEEGVTASVKLIKSVQVSGQQ
ncbi:glycosyltransferase N-terminal domain-containing protein [Yoonia sp. GPGPB17]|uniref:3-deoxy-D-manno-octulosonic acid transferase n=1 Tax=Yoonia sp. GPGPB17 TaxID=3026147 RepID=UPI0030BE8A54